MSKSRLEGSHIKTRKTVVEIGPTQSKSAVFKKKIEQTKLTVNFKVQRSLLPGSFLQGKYDRMHR